MAASTKPGYHWQPILAYLPGYVAWEHELGHHDPLTDIFSLGLVLASLACAIDLQDPADLERFVAQRRNLFALRPDLHPVLAQVILRMTELDRHQRAQDLAALLRTLENYRDQSVDLEIDLATIPGFQTRDLKTRRELVLSKLRDRLFDLSRRNNLLQFRPTSQSVNLTQSSIPLTLDVRNIRPDQILVWSENLRGQLLEGKPISLNRRLNFAEALYLPSLLDRVIAEARRDQLEFGFAQLRLVLCFLSWANLKVKPAETYYSPLVLLPVSQVPLEEAVPSLFRAGQTIIVGDEMQLPPTDFFTARGTAAEDDEEQRMVEDDDDDRIAFDLSSDSLLNHAAKNLPATMLGWHYRSRSEALISFSNWAFYDGRLLTVPDRRLLSRTDPAPADAAGNSPSLELLLGSPVSFHWLAHGLYDRRRNRPEAEHIARLVAGLLKERSGLTIGVIAFSEAQQEEIESALGRLAQQDDEFRSLYESELLREVEGQFVGLLVKNLENIQGDERDVILLSVCYGRGPNGKMLMNFGPINKSGGEKRLNVAFSRAKQRMAVVSSIRHGDITNDYNDGANCLKSYLKYAEALSNGDAGVAVQTLASLSRWRERTSDAMPAADAVAEQLAEMLRHEGYEVEEGVGQSHFRVDVAVRAAGDRDYRLGILVDSSLGYEQTEPLEREMMRPRLLRDFGWRILRLFARDWYLDRDAEYGRVMSALGDPHSFDQAEQEARQAQLDSTESDEPADPENEVGTNANGLLNGNDSPDKDSPVDAPSEPSSPPVAAAKRRLVFQEGSSHKFWEIEITGASHRVRFGRVGSSGQALVKDFPDADAARRDADRLIAEKLRKGYREQGKDADAL